MNTDLTALLESAFGKSNDVEIGELQSLVNFLERHGNPMQVRQARALSYAKMLIPNSEQLRLIEDDLLASFSRCMNPAPILQLADSWTMASRVTGKLPLSRAFNGDGVKR